MTDLLVVHPATPHRRQLDRAVDCIRGGGVIAYPTDSSYALGCAIGNKTAMDRIRKIRRVGNEHNFTLVCRDLSELSLYSRVDNHVYRLLKRFTPGPYTFILPATREVPRRLQNPKRKTIGLRVPAYPIVSMLLEILREPIMSSTLILPGEELPLNDAHEICSRLKGSVDLVLDGGPCEMAPTSVIEFVESMARIARYGRGDVSAFDTR